MLRGDDEEEPGRGLLPLPGYPYPRAVSVPELPPRITVFPPGSFANGCNDWPSACQPHFALHAMLTSWILTRPLAAVAGFITPATFRNLDSDRSPGCHPPGAPLRQDGRGSLLQHPQGIQGPGDVRPGPDDAATATGKCFKTVFLMTDAKHAVLELRRMHAAGNLTVCGEKPALVFSDAIAADREYSVPVFVDSLVGRKGNESAVEAVRREHLFAARSCGWRQSSPTTWWATRAATCSCCCWRRSPRGRGSRTYPGSCRGRLGRNITTTSHGARGTTR